MSCQHFLRTSLRLSLFSSSSSFPQPPPCPTAAPRLAAATTDAALRARPPLPHLRTHGCQPLLLLRLLPHVALSPLLLPSYIFRFSFLALRDVPRASLSNPTARVELPPPPPDLELNAGVHGWLSIHGSASLAEASSVDEADLQQQHVHLPARTRRRCQDRLCPLSGSRESS
ncbi:hypothetical protein NL676_008459 [Syzygium grande]|nr:hypothetical protein NL676_008459 [Syzygium grande]